MKTDAQSLLLLVGGAGFLAYLVLNMLSALGGRDDGFRKAQSRLLDAKRRAGDRSLSNAERAAALRDGASAALEGMRRPGLAAALARRAERLDPGNLETVGLMALALRRAARYSALERFLWKRLAELDGPNADGYRGTFDELVALYDGPLRRPETARVLRRAFVPRPAEPTR
jgi:hypothetical protein